MHHYTITLKSPTALNGLSPHPFDCIQNPRIIPAIFSHTLYHNTKIKKTRFPILNCNKGIEVSVPENHLSFSNYSGQGEGLKSVVNKEFDVATLGNLCVDIVLNVPKLPPSSPEERKAYMDELSKSPPDKVCEIL